MNCLIVDANMWALVFNAKSLEYHDFELVRDSILNRNRTLAWGGSTYSKELECATKYLSLYLEFTRAGIACKFDDHQIDKEEERLINEVNCPDFDDPHIIAIQIVSRSDIIVTRDARSHKYIKDKSLYPKNHSRPRIYGGGKHGAQLI